MKVISMISRKGGVGKTTSLMALASVASAKNLRTILIDTDQNEPMEHWRVKADAYGFWPDNLKVERQLDFQPLHDRILEIDEKGEADLVLIDPKGGWAADFHNFLVQAIDVMIIPTRPNKLDGDEVISTLKTLAALKKKVVAGGGSIAKPYVLLNYLKAPSAMTAVQTAWCETLTQIDGCLKTQLRDRAAYQTMVEMGPLLEYIKYLKDGEPMERGQANHLAQALKEAEGLFDEIMQIHAAAEAA